MVEFVCADIVSENLKSDYANKQRNKVLVCFKINLLNKYLFEYQLWMNNFYVACVRHTSFISLSFNI